MKKPVRDLLLLLVIVVVAGGIGYWQLMPSYPQRPDFSLPDLHGNSHSASEYDGRVVVLNFWASWCIPCREEVPMLVKAQKELSDAGLQIVGIAIDKRAPVENFAKRYHIDYPVLVSLTKGPRLQDKLTAITDSPAAVLPYSVIIDRQGRIRAGIAGKLTRPRLNKLVQPLLKEHKR